MKSAFEKRRGGIEPWKAIAASGMSLVLIFGQSIPALGNPSGGVVVAGSATIGPSGQTLTINQASNAAIINWQQFSIASGELTKFIVPNSVSATLNRVLGGNPSAIYGTLQSNGIVYLINPNGILVGPSGRIDTAGFLGSTLDISNDEFLKGGDLHFLGASDASVDNQGTIHASGGDVYLIASQVNNSGTITAPKGEVGLAAGTDILYAQAGDQHLFIQPTPAGTTRALGVTNSGTIKAASAELKAAGGNAYALAIKQHRHGRGQRLQEDQGRGLSHGRRRRHRQRRFHFGEEFRWQRRRHHPRRLRHLLRRHRPQFRPACRHRQEDRQNRRHGGSPRQPRRHHRRGLRRRLR